MFIITSVKRLLDVILGLIAATATALILALIARDAIGMPADIRRVQRGGLHPPRQFFASLLKWLRS